MGRIAERIQRARDALGVPMAIENVSFYWHPGRAEMGEAEFLARVCDAADCGLMLDVNNAYVNSVNFGFDVDEWMRTAPLERVVQVHVAGHEWFAVDEQGIGEPRSPNAPGAMVIDTHGASVPDPVMSLLERVLERTGPVPVVLERDQNIPPLATLLEEVARIRGLVDKEGCFISLRSPPSRTPRSPRSDRRRAISPRTACGAAPRSAQACWTAAPSGWPWSKRSTMTAARGVRSSHRTACSLSR